MGENGPLWPHTTTHKSLVDMPSDDGSITKAVALAAFVLESCLYGVFKSQSLQSSLQMPQGLFFDGRCKYRCIRDYIFAHDLANLAHTTRCLVEASAPARRCDVLYLIFFGDDPHRIITRYAFYQFGGSHKLDRHLSVHH
jgi:hypothetical protein